MENPKQRRPLVAFLLSFLTPGLGQIYNGQMKKAIILWVVSFLLGIFFLITGLFYKFYGMIFCFAVLIGIFLFIMLEAFYSARKLRQIDLKRYNKWYLYIVIIIINLLVVQPLTRSISRTYFRPYRIPSVTMEPTLKVGDHFVVTMKYYKNQKPKRGDIIVFPNPKDPSKDYIKRVIGLESEKVEILHDKLYINDKLLEDPWGAFERKELSGHLSFLENFGPVVVPTGSLFVLGDNRHNSQDSRFWGFVDLDKVKGKALYIYWANDKNRIGNEIK